MSTTKPDNDKNKMGNSTGKGQSAPSGSQHPPAAGSHTAKFANHKGDAGGPQEPGIHHSLKRPQQKG
jgi:hypothetical protein